MQLLKAIKCLFRGKAISTVKQTVNTVEGVEAVYESAIEEAEIKYEKSCSKLIEILGKIDTAEENLEKYKSDLAETEKRCKQLVDSNRIEDAKIYSSTKRKGILNSISAEEENLHNLNMLKVELEKINKTHEQRLNMLSVNKQRDMNAIYISNEVNDIYKQLDPHRSSNETDKLIDHVHNEVAQLAMDTAKGARLLYENKDENKVKTIDAEFEEKDDFIENLIKEKETKEIEEKKEE